MFHLKSSLSGNPIHGLLPGSDAFCIRRCVAVNGGVISDVLSDGTNESNGANGSNESNGTYGTNGADVQGRENN